jgi:hypothetical protein
MKWVEHVACTVEKRDTCKLLTIRPEPRRLIEKLSSVWIILKKNFRHWIGQIELD